MKSWFLILLIYFLVNVNNAIACTNLLISKGASADGSTMITYNADAGGFMDPLYFMSPMDHKDDSVEVYEWDTGKYLGKIKQVPHTYGVIGNINEYQVSLGETTFTGRTELTDTNARVDYGSLMYLALQRAKTAREAIKVMTDLVAEYGYYSSGESFSVADPNEVWILEMISKGPWEKGAVWVAVRIPDGYISAHANQSRIQEFPLNDPENCIYSKDVIDFAIKHNYYNPKKDGKFSFQRAYSPNDPSTLLVCEGRIWSLFRRAAPSLNLSDDYWRAVEGAEPYPLYIKPDKKLSVQDAISLIRDHFEGTPYDMTKGFAAEPFGNPYRWKPLEWKIEGDTMTYAWERPITSQQSAFSFVSPDALVLVRNCRHIMVYLWMIIIQMLYASILFDDATAEIIYRWNITELIFKLFGYLMLLQILHHTKYSYNIKDIQEKKSQLENKFFAFQPSTKKLR